MSEPNFTMKLHPDQNREPSSSAPIRSTKCWFLVQFTCIVVSETGYGHARYTNTAVDRVLICLVNLNEPLEADVSNLEKLVLTAFGKPPATTVIEHLHVKDQASKSVLYTTLEQLVVYLRGEEALWSSQMKRVPNLWECGGNQVTVVFGTKVCWYTAYVSDRTNEILVLRPRMLRF